METPWAVLLCQFKDDTSQPPFQRQRFEKMFTSAGAGKFNLVDFFRDMSHGTVDLSGSGVFGWYNLKHTASEYPGAGGRGQIIKWARDAAAEAGDDLTPYANRVLVITNPPSELFGGPDGAMSGDGRDGAGMSSLSPSLVGQEMGHVYGLQHSRNEDGVEYGDDWDVMSTRNESMAPHPVYTERDVRGNPIFRIGPGLNAANMWGRGWLDPARVWQADDQEFSTVVKLRPLHRRDLPGHLCARIGGYFVEFRVQEGWDAGIPSAGVLVHEFAFNQSYLIRAASGRECFMTGDELVKGDPNDATELTPLLVVRVLEVDPASYTATLQVTVRRDRRPEAGPATTVVGVENDGGGWIIVGGKIVKVPPRSPLHPMIEEIAQLQQGESIDQSQARDLLHRRGFQTLATLANGELSRIESDREPLSDRPRNPGSPGR